MKLKSFFYFLFLTLAFNGVLSAQTSKGTGYNDISEEAYNNLQVSVVTYNGTKPQTFTNWQSTIVPQVGNQGQEDACNAWGLGYACMTITAAMQNNYSIYDANGEMSGMKVFSPAFLYNSLNGGQDNGTNILDMLEFVKTVGAVPWNYMPYVDGQYNVTPPDSLKQIAANYRIKDYARINMDEESIKSHLLNGYPVVISLNAYKGMGADGDAAYKNGTPYFFPEYASASDAEGRHCICIIGYDDTIQTPYGTGAFLVQNSWGQQWGTTGRFFIPYDVFTKNIPGTTDPYIVHGFVVSM
jgi:hypothetical protein